MIRSEVGDYKIKIVYRDLEDKIATEGVWAEKEGEYYRLKNIPFFAHNLAYDDLISVEIDDGEMFFDSLIEPSGHSTIQIVFFNMLYFEMVTEDLVRFNCSWEGSHLKEYISVDVPKTVEYLQVRKYLEQKRKENTLDFKEACLAHITV